MQQDKQKECDSIFFFVVFSPNFITGFPWQRDDNVTKFQLFAEQLPLLFNSLSPSLELFAQFWATASAAARAKAKASKGRASKLHRKITSTCQTHRRPPWPKALRFNAVSPSLSLSAYICPPPLSKGNPSAKRATTHIVYYYPLTANANRIRFNMLPNHNKLCT